MNKLVSGAAILSVGLFGWGCADLDNPTALAELDPVAEFEIEFAEVETMHSVEIVARVREGGGPMHLTQAQLEIEPPIGPRQVVPLEEHEGGYEAHVRFYEPGEHHIHMFGRPVRHHFMRELGEHEVHVERQHQLHEDHRFEIEVSPAPIIEGAPARITVHAFEMEHDGTVGHAAEGLGMHATLHMPNGAEVPLDLTEHEHGEYEGEFFFPMAGSYGLHIEIEAADAHGDEGEEHGDEGEGHDDEGHDDGVEFDLYVPSLTGAPDETGDENGGGHGHGH
jgi:hypothetical protein